MLPDKKTVKNLFDFICEKTKEPNIARGLTPDESVYHYLDVSQCAEKIASHCGLDSHKAKILGLFHDYGEYIERTVPGTFHGTAGYDEMMKLGYDEIARVCLTHSFWEGVYDPEHFSYDKKEVARAGMLISKMELDDYDYLIQLSDMLCCHRTFVKLEERIAYIVNKYKRSSKEAENMKKAAEKLKERFDKLCKQDIYELLEIK